MLLREAAKTHGWNLNYGGIALMWRGGCIIRRCVLDSSFLGISKLLFFMIYFYSSVFLGNIKLAFEKNPNLVNLLLDPFFTDAVHKCQDSWRTVVATAAQLGIPVPCFSTALAFYDGYRSERLPANLIQVSFMNTFLLLL